MKTSLDLKSLLLGLCVGIAAVLGIGAAEGESRFVGRYQCSTAGDLMLIIDTATGQAWAQRAAGLSITGAPAGFWDKKADK